MIPIEITTIAWYNSYHNEEDELVKMKHFVNQYEILQVRNKLKLIFIKHEIHMIINTLIQLGINMTHESKT